MNIRKYKPKDKKQVQHIHWETGCIGKSMSKIYTKKKLWAKKTNYYLEKEPESCFVVEDTQKKKVVGYLFGCLDNAKHNEKKEAFAEISNFIFTYPFSNKKDRTYARNMLKFIYKYIFGKEHMPKEPTRGGHLHINFLPEARGKGLGTKLLHAFFAYAKKKGVEQIKAGSWQTKLNPNTSFWMKNGFQEYSKLKTSYWQAHYPKEKIYLCFYVKKI